MDGLFDVAQRNIAVARYSVVRQLPLAQNPASETPCTQGQTRTSFRVLYLVCLNR
jgi:hypothetical protein